MQEQGATTQKLTVTELDAARREATAQVTGEKMGMGGGINLENLVGDIGRRVDANRVTLMTNWDATAAQLQSQKEGTNYLEQSRVNSVPQGVQPNPLGLVASLGGSAFKTFGDFEKMNRPAGDTGGLY